MTDQPCECPEDGFCVRYNKTMCGRLRQICRGEVLTPEKCAAYRQSWLKERPTLIGDVIETAAKVTGLAAAAKVVEKITGKKCGCSGRKKTLNEAHAKRKRKNK